MHVPLRGQFARRGVCRDDDPEEVVAKDDTDDEMYDAPSDTEQYTCSGRQTVRYVESEEKGDSEEDVIQRTRSSCRVSKSVREFVASDDEEEENGNADYADTVRARRASERLQRRENLYNLAVSRSARRRNNAAMHRASSRLASSRAVRTDPDHSSDETVSSAESDRERHPAARSYSFRARKKVNYSLLQPPPEPPRDGFGRRIRRGSARGSASRSYELEPQASNERDNNASASIPALPYSSLPRSMRDKSGWDTLPLNMSGKDYARAFGDPDDSSDDEPRTTALSAPRSTLGAPSALLENGPTPAAGMGSSADPFGRVKPGDPLADVDPLGVDMCIDFKDVGGLDDHVHQLKEMVSLPLLYPEVFQRFNVTPPRGVLFHGPPGTGKTLVARALAASCSTQDQPISFFMRKGADCLSKWVGEAERQLRLLFEEAKRSQPSIIFFDEIDGLAPVRSSKQDQIHASIVSTLLALMDGMDGRGQVVVIGATNRPDSVDPALRRPGRFDREFYFPLPGKAARLSILQIHTRKWQPPLQQELKDVLAEATTGFGGADLRALCTEATLNAIQRRYPQIYSSTERLELEPTSIHVDGKDFMLALKKMVPSSARSTSAAHSPLAPHLVPLLGDTMHAAVSVFQRLLPPKLMRSALEEAMWEVDPDAGAPSLATETPAGALERELLQESFEKSRVYRPRLVLHGAAGMGQIQVAQGLVHAMEGVHVQTITVSTLLGDSTQTPESALVTLFQEARRLKPSLLFIPELEKWPLLLSNVTRESFGALLDALSTDDPIMLLAACNMPFNELPGEIRRWFGVRPLHQIGLDVPSTGARRAYLKDIAEQAARSPTEFADALPKRRRVLEELPKAPPRPPRPLTQAELQEQVEHDARLLEHLKYRLGPVLGELRKKFKKFTRDVWDEYNLRDLMEQFDWKRDKGKITITLRYDKDGYHSGYASEEERAPVPAPGQLVPNERENASPQGDSPYILRDFTIYTMTLEKMQKRLYYNGYLTCESFIEDINKIVANAEEAREVDADRVFRARQMQNLSTILLDQYVDPAFRAACAQMAVRYRAREEEAKRVGDLQKATEEASRLSGSRHSARVLGQAPEPSELVDVSTIERSHKRVRSSSQGAAQPAEEESAENKRVRTTHPDTPESDAQPQPALDTDHAAPPAMPRAEKVLDKAAQEKLVESLMLRTAGFSVEGLEQTRAICYELILAYRAAWDRTALLADIEQAVQELSRAVPDEDHVVYTSPLR
ncbi:hypothetical protein MVES_001879 [Malassezia vespertilionis]|uniref:AAA+ ATPase domain-containing protein n=1 Tax=Malassezia vespertilionis TaxID=2020962 RepID=A0A2N1JBK2_9BASI|nr:hypothetical protein MVES_001879 [Malassezia vespertilionis]